MHTDESDLVQESMSGVAASNIQGAFSMQTTTSLAPSAKCTKAYPTTPPTKPQSATMRVQKTPKPASNVYATMRLPHSRQSAQQTSDGGSKHLTALQLAISPKMMHDIQTHHRLKGTPISQQKEETNGSSSIGLFVFLFQLFNLSIRQDNRKPVLVNYRQSHSPGLALICHNVLSDNRMVCNFI